MAENEIKVIKREDVMDEVIKMRDTLDRWRVKTEARMETHHAALFGNGKPGLDEEVRNINRSLNTLMKLAWMVVGAIVPVAVTGIVAIIVYLIKIMP